MTAVLRAAFSWATQHFAGLHFGDGRLSNRIVKVASAMAAAPDHSLVDPHRNRADLEAAYRLLNNPKVTPAEI